MRHRSVAEWLRWQESLNPRPVDMGLDRVRQVAARLTLRPPHGAVYTVAGTNGKGSTVACLEALLRRAGQRTGVYTSPHLLRYNERIRIDGDAIDDPALAEAFARVEAVRDGAPLTYFEFGTLAAWAAFQEARCDAWILEVGLGGRLDAVNALDADVALITTIGHDHQEYLGDTLEAIAAEKAGIMRPGRPAFFADCPVPGAITRMAGELGAALGCWGVEFGVTMEGNGWAWWSGRRRIGHLPLVGSWTAAQYRNAGLALAALDALAPAHLPDAAHLHEVLAALAVPGRFQRVWHGEHEWVLDVAHNPQAAAVLRAQLDRLPPAIATTIIVALLGDKAVVPFVEALEGVAGRWLSCVLDDSRALPADEVVQVFAAAGLSGIDCSATPVEAFRQAMAMTPPGGRIVVCGSFRLVAPALQWLGLYSAHSG